MTKSEPDTELLHRIGRAIAQARMARGWTQDTLAHALGISVKNAQRLESGKHDLRLTTVAHAAAALAVPLATLLGGEDHPPIVETTRSTGPLAGLAATGWQPVRRRDDGTEPLIPVVDLRPQAGRLRPQAAPSRVAWARPPEGRRLHGEGWLLARVRGDSMTPEIPDGAWCLFRQPVTELRVRQRVLVRVADEDPSAGGAWVIKCIGSIEAVAERLRLRLDSNNPNHPPQWLEIGEGAEPAVIAELVEVVGSRRG